MTALLAAVLVASLVGSLHCAGMCGGVVAMCVGLDTTGQRRPWRLHATYHLGRMATYVALGAASGAVGAAVDLGGAALGMQRIAAGAAGGLMILFGALALLRARGVRLGCLRLPAHLESLFQRGLRRACDRPPLARALLIGLLTGFLPCGWLYAFVVAAAGTGDAATGALVMAAFWAGTVPVLLVLGLGLQHLAHPLRRHVPTMTAAALVLIGVVTVFGRLSLPAYADLPAPTAADAPRDGSAAAAVVALPTTPPCCDDPGAH